MKNRKNNSTSEKLENFYQDFYQKIDKLNKMPHNLSGIYGGYPIKPKRYVWHTSSYTNRFSIHQDGLVVNPILEYKPMAKNAVFANNIIDPSFWFFNHFRSDYFSIDYFHAEEGEKYYNICNCGNYYCEHQVGWNNLSRIIFEQDENGFKDRELNEKQLAEWGFDYWRIDTYAIKNLWWVDLMWDGNWGASTGREHYVYTDESIPRHAMQLFNFNKEEKIISEKGIDDNVYHALFKPRMQEITEF